MPDTESNPSSAVPAEPQPVESSAVRSTGPAIRYDSLNRPHGPDGKLLPRAGAEAKAPADGAASVFPSAARPAAKKTIRVKPGKRAVQPERVAQARARREIQNQAKETARAITQMMITAVKVGLGEECEPSDALRARIEEPGARILERMDPETSELVAKYADPLQLTMALAEWGAQILRVVREKQKQKASEETGQPVTKEPAKEAEDRNDGHHETGNKQDLLLPVVDEELDLSESPLPAIRPEQLEGMMENHP